MDSHLAGGIGGSVAMVGVTNAVDESYYIPRAMQDHWKTTSVV